MNSVKEFFKWVAAVMAAFLLFYFLVKSGALEGDRSENRIDTLYIPFNDTWHEKVVPVPTPYVVEIPGTPGATITIPSGPIDSLAIFIDYCTKRHYLDSLKNDSIDMFVSFNTQFNKAHDLKMRYKWHLPTLEIHKTEVVKYQNVFIGVDITGGKDHFGVYPSAYFDTKYAMYGYGYDPINNYHKIGAYGKISWKKRQKKTKN